jgi:gamma-glutamyltranspeptidase / glutathione hydrolase
VPLEGCSIPATCRARAALIGERIASTPPGRPAARARPRGPDHTIEPGGTTQFVIVDADGNVLSMTTTVESIFGSGRMVDGFFLNNQLTDFSFSPHGSRRQCGGQCGRAGQAAALGDVADHRARSRGAFVAATGSAGGPAIIAYVLKTLVGTLDWHMSMQAAISLPNLVAHGAHFFGRDRQIRARLLEG